MLRRLNQIEGLFCRVMNVRRYFYVTLLHVIAYVSAACLLKERTTSPANFCVKRPIIYKPKNQVKNHKKNPFESHKEILSDT